jgi:hypothetical protein
MKLLNESEVLGLVLERLYQCRKENDRGMISGHPRFLGEFLSKKQVLDACAVLAKKKLIRFKKEYAHILPKGETAIKTNGKKTPMKIILGVGNQIQQSKKNALSTKSVYVESIQKHILLGQLLQRMWERGLPPLEILHSEDGTRGYDFVLGCGKILRHVELKSGQNLNVGLGLAEAPSGCVLRLKVDSNTLQIDSFSFFGGPPGKSLPDIHSFKTGKHNRGDKNPRPNIRKIPKSKFEKLESFDDLIHKLFGF